MSFGTELQSKTSHEALLGLQDFEIKFLEHIKRCIFQRIKIDRDHSLALSSLASQIIKFDNAEFETPMSKAWLNIGREIENYSRLLHDMTDKVCAQSLDKLQQLISEKKLVRKMYQEERCRLESICKQKMKLLEDLGAKLDFARFAKQGCLLV
ncbi:hypothetical protein HELRODRAFT_165824 [Helobdella robusta]|uniref:FCH domain-containing protein n=1 Tax=Helobdella robusta TaxID=6412 RepID=T1EXC1_HELRO|nr:hypothetical protein HELRODRAFT_165824 [Helobdella robusta]ESN91755.1 hypothetical protein HELRODRAFT_165824 [Helobdella robusta]